MADVPEEVCAFCKEGEEAGSLRNTSNKNILAHINCLLFSPRVITEPQQNSQNSTVEFNLLSVKKEIKRGRKLKCSYCNKMGATVGCNVKMCWRTYHYLCVTKAKGIRIRDVDEEQYIAYCFEHSEKDQDASNCQLDNGTKTSRTSITSPSLNKSHNNKTPAKRKNEIEHSSARKKLRLVGKPDPECEESVTKVDTSVITTPPRVFQESLTSPARERISSSSTDSSSSWTPEILRSVSLSGFPEKNKKHKQNGNNPELETALFTMPPEERKAYSQLYDEVGGSLDNSTYNDCDDEQKEDAFSYTMEDIPKVQHTGTYARSDGSNLKIATLEPSVTTHAPDQSASSTHVHDATSVSSDKQQLMKSPNINYVSSEQHTKDTKNNDLVLAGLGKKVKKHAAHFSSHTPNKKLGSANTDILSDKEPKGSPNLSKTTNDQPMNPQFTSKPPEDQCKQSSGVSKTSAEQPTRAITTKALVHAVNSHDSDVPVDQEATVLNKQSQSVAPLSDISTGTELLIGQPSYSSFVNSKCKEMAESSPRAKAAFLVKEPHTSKEETSPTSHGVRNGKASEMQNETFHPSPQQIKVFSEQLTQGVLRKKFEHVTLRLSSPGKSAMTSPSKLQSKKDDLASEKSPEHSIVSQQTQNYLSNVDGNLESSDDQAKMNFKTIKKETYNESDSEYAASSTEVKDQGEITKHEYPDGMEFESPEPFQTSNKVGQCTTNEDHIKMEDEWSKTSSLSVKSNEKESSINVDHNRMQGELCKSSLESTRKEESSRGKQHDDIHSQLCESSSEGSRKEQSSEGEDIDKIETESPAASLFSHSASKKSDLILPENTSWRNGTSEETNMLVLNQETINGDVGFATNLIQFLRKVPEDKKLYTQISILNVLALVLGQKPMSTSNPDCVPQQYANPSSPGLSGQTVPPKP